MSSSSSKASSGIGGSSSPAGGLRGAVAGASASASASAAPRRPAVLARLAVGAGVGRFEIDDLAQQDLVVDQFVAPDDDGLEGQRAFAQAGDHRLAAGLDALGDGDFALARQQFDRTHFAQIHAHGIVGAVGGLGGARRDGAWRAGASTRSPPSGSSSSARGGFFLGLVGFLGLDDVDAHFVEHGVDVLDLVGGDFLGRQHGVQFGIGDEAPLLGGLDHPLDGGVGQIQQRAVGGLDNPGLAFRLRVVFFRHVRLQTARIASTP